MRVRARACSASAAGSSLSSVTAAARTHSRPGVSRSKRRHAARASPDPAGVTRPVSLTPSCTRTNSSPFAPRLRAPPSCLFSQRPSGYQLTKRPKLRASLPGALRGVVFVLEGERRPIASKASRRSCCCLHRAEVLVRRWWSRGGACSCSPGRVHPSRRRSAAAPRRPWPSPQDRRRQPPPTHLCGARQQLRAARVIGRETR